MPRALLYYLAQAWTADRSRQAHRETPAPAPRRARHARPSPRPHRARGLPVVATRRLRAVLGGGRP
jgi:hypothetical protein